MTLISLGVFVISIIIAFIIGGIFGIFIMCCLIAAGKADKKGEEGDND